MYTENRIKNKSIPNEIFKYEIRVNFGGTVLLKKKIELNGSNDPGNSFFNINDGYELDFDKPPTKFRRLFRKRCKLNENILK